MPEAIVPSDEVVDRLLAWVREKLVTAAKNGQRIRVDAREGSPKKRLPADAVTSLSKLLMDYESDGSLDLHIYIEPKR